MNKDLLQEELGAILKAITGLTQRMTKLEKEIKKASKCCGQCAPVPFDDEDNQKIW